MTSTASNGTQDQAPLPRSREISTAFVSDVDCGAINKIFDQSRRERIGHSGPFLPAILTADNLDHYRPEAAQVEALFATWGIPAELLTPDHFPKLRVIFYAAGSIKGFGRPLLERGIQITTAKVANAVCVAQFCLAQIILACKGYFRNARDCREPATATHGLAFAGSGVYGAKIALLGMGAVARELVSLLRPFQVQILAVDPYLTAADAEKLGVQVVTLEQAYAEASIVSNHLPNLPPLERILDRSRFASMRRDATFINTGRGQQVVEADLIEVFSTRPDLTALLDVTYPEPPLPGSPLYRLPNIQLSSHLAGATNHDLHRLGDCVIEELERYRSGQPLRYAESLESLDRMA
jgi:phosphoglycerate dehydrogenase-like enzyme